jgi:hypothetical protein
MPSRKPRPVRVFFHARGRDPESAWCTPLSEDGHYRLDNILVLHERPVFGDTVLAAPSERFDGQLAYRRIVRGGGRFTMILDYPEARQRAQLGALLKRRFDAVSEGAFGPEAGGLGRLYAAVPERFAAREVFLLAAEACEGVVAVHPKLRAKAASRAPAPSSKAPAKPPSLGRVGELVAAIRRNDAASFASATAADLTLLDEKRRPLLFLAVLDGRLEIVRRLVVLGADLNPKTFPPLYAAAMRNRAKEARLLIEAGARADVARDKDGDPVLVTAAFRENIDVLRVLLSVPHAEETKSLALLEAAGVGNLAIVRLLVEHGADPAWVSSRGNSAIAIARARKKREVVAYLRSHPGMSRSESLK